MRWAFWRKPKPPTLVERLQGLITNPHASAGAGLFAALAPQAFKAYRARTEKTEGGQEA